MAQRPKTRAAGTVKRSGKTKPAQARRAPAKTKKAAETVEAPKKSKSPKSTAAAKKAPPAKATQPKAVRPAAKKATAKKPATKKTKAQSAATKAARGKTVKVAKTATAPKVRAAKTAKRASKPIANTKSVKTVTAKQARKPAKGLAKIGVTATVRRPRKLSPAPVSAEPPYLAAELGQPVDYEGEPIGAGSATVRTDKELQDYTLQLWRQMQSGGVVNRYMRAIERAGLTIDEVWTAGVVETRSTSSTADEMRRYREKLLFRANLLEAILSETVADLHRLEGIEPGDVKPQAAEAAAADKTAAPAAETA